MYHRSSGPSWAAIIIVTILFATILMGCGSPASAKVEPLTVSAAADLTPAFREIGEQFQQKTGIPVVFNFGSTGQATQQIMEGAPIDLFAAANIAYIDELNQAGLIIPDSITVYARGRITLWLPADSPLQIYEIADLADPAIKRIAVANPDHAPYGVAAREALQSAGLWDDLQARLVFGNNIAQTLQLAETGSVDVAIMALSLSLASDGRWTFIPESLHTPLDQALAIITSTPHEAAARRFSAYVSSPEGRAIMRRYGFILPGEESDS